MDDRRIIENVYEIDDDEQARRDHLDWLDGADYIRAHNASLDEEHGLDEEGRVQVIVDGDTKTILFVGAKGSGKWTGAATLAEVNALRAQGNHGAHSVEERPGDFVCPAAPPAGEALIALFCGAAVKEAILGDLAEKFEERARERGEENARNWYWWQVARSFGPFAWRWGRRLVALDDLRQLIGW